MENKTAVEWLLGQLLANGNIRWRGTSIFDLSDQAKEMEKKQIIEAFNCGNGASDLAYGSEYFKKKFKK